MGTGTLTLEAANSYSLGTTIAGGSLSLGSYDGGNENGGALGAGPVSVSGKAVLLFGGVAGGVVTYTIPNNFNLNGGVLFNEDGYQQLNGTVTIGHERSDGHTPNGAAKMWPFPNSQVRDRSLSIARLPPAAPQRPLVVLCMSAVTPAIRERSRSIQPASQRWLGPVPPAWAASLKVDSAAALTDAAVVMNSTRGMVFSVGNPVFGSLSGSGAIALNLTTTSAFGSLTIGGLNTNTVYSGVLSGTGGLIKAGSGLTAVSAVETYTGATTVNGGTLQLNNGSMFPSNTILTINSGPPWWATPRTLFIYPRAAAWRSTMVCSIKIVRAAGIR